MAELVALAMLAALVLYALLGGADFGGGVWDLFASGPRAKQQRELISHAMAPVWEANHVWLILVVVLMFSAFPSAFARIMTELSVPLTLMLVGIVLRGSAFVFRQYAGSHEELWGRVFAVSSLLTPLLLGACVGSLTSGEAWTAAYPLSVGAFTLALFAMLAAVYLTLERTDDEALREDFRRRAMISALVAAGLAGVTSWLRFDGRALAFSVPIGAALLISLSIRRYALARWCAIALVTLVIVAWGLTQRRLLAQPAPEALLRLLVPTLGVGALILFPSLWWLLRVFKGRQGQSQRTGEDRQGEDR